MLSRQRAMIVSSMISIEAASSVSACAEVSASIAGAAYAVLVLSRLRPGSVPWAVWRLARGPRGLGRVPGLSFARVLGSGRDAGFGLVPGLDVQGIFAPFDSLDAAQAWADRGPGLQAYADRAIDHLRESIAIAKEVGSDALSLWFADGANYPGQACVRRRKRRTASLVIA